MKNLKKILASALLVCMLVSMLPVGALAEGEVCTHSETYVETFSPGCTTMGSNTIKCSACGTPLSSETIPATGHSFSDANCTAPKTCAVCGATEGAALGHIAGEPVTEPASCAADGSTTVSCSACGAAISSTVIPATGIHTPGEAYVTTEATCTTEGSSAVACTVCGGVLNTGVIPALGHSYGEAVTKEASCTETGVKTFTCSGCGDSYTETIAVLDHSFLNATCTAPRTCGKCGASEGEPLGHDYADATCTVPKTCKVCTATEGEPLGHTAGETVTEPATCTVDGSITVKCSVCGEAASTEIISAPGHTPGEETVITEATCTTDGSKSVKCTVCGEAYTVIIPAAGHTAGEETVITEATCTTDGSKSVKCTVCGEIYTVIIPATGHSFADATCTTPKTCTVCEAEDGYPLGHTEGEHTVTKEATCEEAGEEIIRCAAEGCEYSETTEIPALGHKYNDDHVCSVCGEKEPLMKSVAPVSNTFIITGDNVLHVGETITLSAVDGDNNPVSVTWSSNSAVATVAADGTVTGEAKGKATITATANDGSGVSASVDVYVQEGTTPYIYVEKSEINIGETAKVRLVYAGNNAPATVTWSVYPTTIATITPDSSDPLEATVTGIAAGYVSTISATYGNGNQSVNAGNAIFVKSPITGISISGPDSVVTRKTIDLDAAITPDDATDKTVTWESSDPTTATVDENGVVTGIKKGTVTITATANDGSGVDATHSVTVEEIAVSIDGASTVLIEKTITLTATVTPADATDKTVTWKSSDETIATVDKDGKVTGKKADKVIITATSNADPNKSASKEITVKAPSLTVSGPGAVAVGNTITLTAKVSPDEVTDKSVTWTSSDSTIATVDKNGVVKGVKTDDVRIKATSNYDSKLSAEHSVRVIVPVYLYYGNGTHFNGIHPMPFVSSDLWAGGAGVSVVINGIPLVPGRDFSCYSSPSGMIGVTVHPGMLRLLPQNTWHTIDIISANGVASGYFSTGYFGYYNINGVKTGDDSTPLLWAALCLLGISGAGIILVKSRKRKA